jgi:hypothetical protein
MKRIIYAVIVVAFIFASCKDTFFSEPVVPPSQANKAGSPPENLSASQGEKRAITLSWNQMTNAALYYIYRAASPLDVFVRCGETTVNNFTFNVQPGSTVYYRVSSVSFAGIESSQSFYVRGTSLAQPVITDITEVSESGSTVTWYMDNVSGDTYKNNLLYTIYCFYGSMEVAQLALDGSLISENKAVFAGLNANTRYEYQVEAYLRSDQNTSEKSEKMDVATARRFKPGPPLKLHVARGTAVDKIELSFELPDMVDIALGENLYDPKPLYFVIFKRLYTQNHLNEYQKVCSYFGSVTGNGGLTFNGYIPGASVRWVDANVNRGVEYEYMVQSYVDGTPRVISSDDSKSSAVGWTLSEGNLSFMDIEYQYVSGQDLFGSARLPLDFEFNPKGVVYRYTLVETIDPLGDEDPNDAVNRINRRIPFTAGDIYIPTMDLTRKTDQNNPGRGLYSYVVQIRLDGISPESDPLDVIEAIGQVEVSENTQPLVVEKFSVLDGYTDKFIFRWHYWSNRKYIIYESLNKNGPWNDIGTINANPGNDNNATENVNFEWTYSGQTTGTVKYFAIQPYRALGGNEFKQGQKVYASAASRTLGVPKISKGEGYAYSAITALWTEAQKADTYRIKYWYTDEGGYQSATVAKTVKASELSFDALGQFKFTFSPFADNVADVGKAGKEIQIAVDALNEGLRATVGGGEISTTSAEEVRLRLVGPALLNLSASKAVSTSEITVSWNGISGADGYYVFRRQFNMTNTAEEGIESVVYYIPAFQSSSINVTGKNLLLDTATNAKVDTSTVKATASFSGSAYRLQDIYLPDNEYTGNYNRHTLAYRDQQNNLAQGYPYRYYVVPVVDRGGAPEPLSSIDFTYGKDGYNKNTSITSYTIRENNSDVRYSGAASIEQEGFAIGFGQNVVATKGTYASSGNVNNGIEITWDPPPRLSTVAGFNPRYTLYRKAATSSTWIAATSNISERRYIDDSQNLGRGVAYEYVIGITNGGSGGVSQPQYSQRFIDLCNTLRDEKNRPRMLGYMLGMVKVDSVSRGENAEINAQFAEEIRWPSAGITNSASTDPNWGIDGYMVFVMNRNISSGWHEIANITNIPNQTDQSVRVTNGTGLLKVLRDYKHFFKVRSYVLKGDEKIYCPDPEWTYKFQFGTTQAAHIAASKAMENDYVKWGARQITRDEFIQITTLFLARGIEPNGWLSALAARTYNASTNMGGSGSVRVSSNAAVTSWDLRYNSYKNDMNLKTGDWVTFITINGTVWAGTGASTAPQRYGDQGWVDVIGPWDLPVIPNTSTPVLYTGKFRIGGDNNDMYWNNANNHIYIQYPSANMIHKWKTESTACEKVEWRGINTPLPYSGQNGGNARYGQEAWL